MRSRGSTDRTSKTFVGRSDRARAQVERRAHGKRALLDGPVCDEKKIWIDLDRCVVPELFIDNPVGVQPLDDSGQHMHRALDSVEQRPAAWTEIGACQKDDLVQITTALVRIQRVQRGVCKPGCCECGFVSLLQLAHREPTLGSFHGGKICLSHVRAAQAAVGEFIRRLAQFISPTQSIGRPREYGVDEILLGVVQHGPPSERAMGIGRWAIGRRERLGKSASRGNARRNKEDALRLARLGEQRDQDPPGSRPGRDHQHAFKIERVLMGMVQEPRHRGLHRGHRGIEPVGWHGSPFSRSGAEADGLGRA